MTWAIAMAWMWPAPKRKFRHPPQAAYLLLAVPCVALVWRNSRPVQVLGLAVGGAVRAAGEPDYLRSSFVNGIKRLPCELE